MATNELNDNAFAKGDMRKLQSCKDNDKCYKNDLIASCKQGDLVESSKATFSFTDSIWFKQVTGGHISGFLLRYSIIIIYTIHNIIT